MIGRRFVLTMCAVASAACGGAVEGNDAAVGNDARASDASMIDAAMIDAAMIDAAVIDAPAIDAAMIDAARSPDTGPVVCDAASRPDLGTTVQSSQGLVIARDGTMFVSQPGGVGRRLPDGTLDTHWLMVADTSVFLGLTLDPSNETLFAVALARDPSSPTLLRVAIATATATPLLTGGFPVDVVMGPDGMLYYTENAQSAVMRMSPTGGAATRVTTADLASPTGLAFEASGTLLVGESYHGRIDRITLDATGLESARAMVTFFGDPRGVALDARGRIYVTSGFGNFLARMDADGTNQTMLATGLGGAPSYFDFGHGALCGTDVFVAQSTIVRVMNDTPGAAVPWH